MEKKILMREGGMQIQKFGSIFVGFFYNLFNPQSFNLGNASAVAVHWSNICVEPIANKGCWVLHMIVFPPSVPHDHLPWKHLSFWPSWMHMKWKGVCCTIKMVPLKYKCPKQLWRFYMHKNVLSVTILRTGNLKSSAPLYTSFWRNDRGKKVPPVLILNLGNARSKHFRRILIPLMLVCFLNF